mmetsp:Transcript_167809/g.533569  ORF Transcript_167809/g.533569 Transcript_167809/m.533569 type:complete len:360 (+) Transcript_167809:77-1156(+)
MLLDGFANREGLSAMSATVPAAGPARIDSASRSSSRETLRNFRKRQRHDLASVTVLTGEDRTAAMVNDGQLAANALEARDADELVRLVGRLVGYLEAPQVWGARLPRSSLRSAAHNIVLVSALSESSSQHGEQRQLRDVVLRLLGVIDERGLDTDDFGTRKLLKIPLKRILRLVPTQSCDRVNWREQWIELRRAATGSGHGPGPQVHPLGMVEVPRRQALRRSEWARTSGVYEPNSRVKQLATVIHEVASPIVLKCSNCPHTITSAWYFVHPKTGNLHVLVPKKGHLACRAPSKISPLMPVDGSPHKPDHVNILDMCPHSTERHTCRSCNPAAFCLHGKRRSACQVCRVGLKKRRRQPR